MFDLPGYIVTRLENAGVNATWTGHCTYADEKRFSLIDAKPTAMNRTTAVRYLSYH